MTNPPNNSDLDRVASMIQANDESYAKAWVEDTVRYANLGVYGRVIETLRLKEGDIHLDAGCGLSIFLAGLKEKYPKATLLGVDKNEAMIMASVGVFRQQSGVFNAVLQKSMKVNHAKQRFDFAYEMDEQHLSKLLSLVRGNVNLICDDLANPKVLIRILEGIGGDVLDSGSFLFPGVSPTALVEVSAHNARLAPMEQAKAIAVIMQKTRRKVMEFFARFMKQDGRLVIAERVQMIDDRHQERIHDSYRDQFPGLHNDWEFGVSDVLIQNLSNFGVANPDGNVLATKNMEPGVVTLDAKDGGVPMLLSGGQQDMKQFEGRDHKTTVVIQEFIRKKKSK